MSNKQKRLLKEINSKKFGKEVLVYNMIGNLVYEFQTIHETSRVLGIPRSAISSMCVGNSGRYHNYILRFKGEKDPGRSHFIKKSKNISYKGPFYFYIENITNPIDRKIFINKVSIERYIGLYNRDKKFQKGFKELLTKTDDDFIILKNYKIRFIYALSNSNIAKEVRQSGLVPEVIE